MIETVTNFDFDTCNESQKDKTRELWNGRKIKPLSEDSITISITWEFKYLNLSVERKEKQNRVYSSEFKNW